MTDPKPDPADFVWIRSSAGWPGGGVDEYVAYSRSEWDEMGDAQREETLTAIADDTLSEHGCGAGASVVDLADVPTAEVAEALR